MVVRFLLPSCMRFLQHFSLAFLLLLVSACGPATENGGSQSSAASSELSSVMYENDDGLILDAPSPDAPLTSPVTVIGRARGTWFFEASFPVRLYNANNEELAVGIAQAQDDWMTENYVSFMTTLTFEADTPTGTLVFQKDNPSGLPEYDKEVRVPVRFE